VSASRQDHAGSHYGSAYLNSVLRVGALGMGSSLLAGVAIATSVGEAGQDVLLTSGCSHGLLMAGLGYASRHHGPRGRPRGQGGIAMKNTLQMLFGLMIVFGAIFLNDGRPKEPYTLTYEIGLLVVGTAGMAVLGIIALCKKSNSRDKPDEEAE
jgi:hypothetical protein